MICKHERNVAVPAVLSAIGYIHLNGDDNTSGPVDQLQFKS